MKPLTSLVTIVLGLAFPQLCMASPLPGVNSYTYADIADLAVDASIVADVKIRSATRLKGPTQGVRAGAVRYLIEADVLSLIRGDAAIPKRIRYVADLGPDSPGGIPKLKKARLFVFAHSVPGRANDLQLVQPDAFIPVNADTDQTVRAILKAVTSSGAAPRIAEVGSAFHVSGTVTGEGESQIFLITTTGEPVSLSVVRRPGEIARWSVAFGDIVDQAARPPEPKTLGWYRLACFLPRNLPESSLSDISADDAVQARADYRIVIDGLGPCPRARPAALQPRYLSR